jgi:hypothetical protein
MFSWVSCCWSAFSVQRLLPFLTFTLPRKNLTMDIAVSVCWVRTSWLLWLLCHSICHGCVSYARRNVIPRLMVSFRSASLQSVPLPWLPFPTSAGLLRVACAVVLCGAMTLVATRKGTHGPSVGIRSSGRALRMLYGNRYFPLK